MASLGKNTILIARREKELLAVKSEILERYPDVKVVIVTQDLGNISELETFYQSLKSYPIDIWINNAGFGRHKPFVENSISEILDMIRLNVESLTILSNLFAKDHQNEAGAKLLNVSSVAGYTVFPNVVLYSATKFYVNAFTEGLADEMNRLGAKLQVKVIAPAATQTNFAKIADDQGREVDYRKRYGEFNTSEELADFIVQLLDSDKIVGVVNRNFRLDLKEPKFTR